MRNFCDYLNDRTSVLSKYDAPDYFMSFTEAKWVSNDSTNPNGILLFPIHTTMKFWDNNRFSLFEGPQEKIHIIKVNDCIGDYTLDDFDRDVENLRELYKEKFEPNQKLIDDYREKLSNAEEPMAYRMLIEQETERFNHIVSESTKQVNKPSKKLWELTKWIANNGKDPSIQFAGNAPQRWTNVFQNLGYKGFAFESIAIFFNSKELEIIDEINNKRST